VTNQPVLASVAKAEGRINQAAHQTGGQGLGVPVYAISVGLDAGSTLSRHTTGRCCA
jgi:hypothetical protein